MYPIVLGDYRTYYSADSAEDRNEGKRERNVRGVLIQRNPRYCKVNDADVVAMTNERATSVRTTLPKVKKKHLVNF